MVDHLTEIPLPGRSFVPQGRTVTRGSAVALPSFVAGEENRLVAHVINDLLETASATVESASRKQLTPQIIEFFGPSGVGKTHLARGLARHWQQQRGADAAEYITASDFRRQYHASLGDNAPDDLRLRLCEYEFLAIDDVHQLPQNEHLSQELRHTIDACEENGVILVVTSTRPIATLANLTPDVRSRISAGLSLQLAAPGSDARLQIVQHAANALGHTLSTAAGQRLAAAITGPASELFAALFELFSTPATDEISDLERAQKLLDSRAAHRPTLREIIAAVANHCHLPQKEIKSTSRKQSAVLARELVVYLARELSGTSYDQIGRTLGGRDHTTIMHNYRKIDRDRLRHPAVQQALHELRHNLTGQ